MAQPRDDGEHRVEVLRLLALPRDLDELLHDPHPLRRVRLRNNLIIIFIINRYLIKLNIIKYL